VQFMLDGERAGPPVSLGRNGQASWAGRLEPGKHKVAATYIPGPGSAFLPSSSPDKEHTVGGVD